MLKIYVPRDMLSKALGADEVAEAIAREAEAQKISVQIIRNSSRGLAWLEPFVEIDSAKGRMGYAALKLQMLKAYLPQIFLKVESTSWVKDWLKRFHF